MRTAGTVGRVIGMLLLASRIAHATPLLDLSASLLVTDPTQLGRLNRSGVDSEWSVSKPFPGTFDPTNPYHYHAYVLNVGMSPFIQVEFDSGVNLFIAAYDTAYNPLSLSTNYLGDPGVSGNAFGVDSLFFQVIVPQHHDLVIVVNNTGAGNVGVGDLFHLTVEGFIDTAFTDPPGARSPVPEPATFVLCATGLAWMGLKRRRERQCWAGPRRQIRSLWATRRRGNASSG